MKNKLIISSVDATGVVVENVELTPDKYNTYIVKSTNGEYIGTFKYHTSSNRIEILDNPIKMKTIAVISKTVDQFYNYIKENNIQARKGGRIATRRIETEDVKYICITNPNHVKGYMFDSIIELEGVYLNPNYDKIKEYLKPVIRK